MLIPAILWQALSKLAPNEAKAIVAYLRTIPAIENSVPGPFGPNEGIPSV
jgi:hypothetical protein